MALLVVIIGAGIGLFSGCLTDPAGHLFEYVIANNGIALFGGSFRDEFFLSGYGDLWIEARALLGDHADITTNVFVQVVRSCCCCRCCFSCADAIGIAEAVHYICGE